MAAFRFKEILDLLSQLMLSPAEVIRRYADRLEGLLLEFDPERTYPHDFVYFRITGFRPKEHRLESYTGRDVLPDLLQALERISDAVPRDVGDMDEKVYTLEQLQDMCSVSVRTVHRWRRRGLVSRKYVFPDGRKRTGIRQVALERFVERNRGSVQWSARFSKLTKAEQARILELARRCARREGLTLTATANRVAERVKRAPETVRLLLKRYDRDHPHAALFGHPARQLGAAARRRIYADYRRGTPVEALQERHGRSRSSIYRIINQGRAAEALQETPSYLYEEVFAAKDADAQILGPELRTVLGAAQAPSPRSEPLTKHEEVTLFRAYNYVKFLIAEAHKQLNPRRYVPASLIRRIRTLKQQAQQIKDCLLRAHLPLVERVARQHAGPMLGFQELTAEGRACLRELVESFDYRRRWRYPRYATLELLKRFARVIPEPSTQTAHPQPERP